MEIMKSAPGKDLSYVISEPGWLLAELRQSLNKMLKMRYRLTTEYISRSRRKNNLARPCYGPRYLGKWIFYSVRYLNKRLTLYR